MEANLSFWEKSSFYKKSQLLVVGAGIVGLCSAIFYKLENPKAKVLITDRELIPKGASTRNAGFACFGSMTELISDIEHQGEAFTMELVAQRWLGLLELRRLVGDDEMDFRQTGGYELFLNADQSKWAVVLKYLKKINQQIDTIVEERDTFSISSKQFGFQDALGLIYNKAEGQLDPGKMITALIKKCHKLGIQIVRGLQVLNIIEHKDHVEITTKEKLSLKADQILVATNGFSKNLFPNLDLQPARNQVLITSPIDGLKIDGCYHYDQGYVYFRNVGNRVLMGGGRNWDLEQEQTADYGDNKLIREKLMDFMNEKLLRNVNWKIEQEWSGILGVGKKKQPIIRKTSDRIGVAIRLGGMGVAIGCSVGKQAAAMMT